MFSALHRSTLPGWIGFAGQAGLAALALVQRNEQGQPAVRWIAQANWQHPDQALQALRKHHPLHRHARVALLDRNAYQCVPMDAPEGLAAKDWPDAVRWLIKDTRPFAVDGAAIDVLAVPSGTSYRTQQQLIAVAAAEPAMRSLVELASDVDLPWQAVDVRETALRNLSALVEPAGHAQALLHCQQDHATLVVTFGGELVSTRQMELQLVWPDGTSDERRMAAYDQAGLELQRTLDGIERAFGQVSLARLLITPMPDVQGLCNHLGPLLYVPVAPLVLDEAVDFSAVPQLLSDPALMNQHLCAIGAALRT
jgi:MSHA biogenesis protein MshI